IHRASCSNFRHLAARNPERVIDTRWGDTRDGLFAVDVEVEAHDRAGLLRDVGEIFTRERANVTGSRTASRRQVARMSFTVEVASLASLDRILGALGEVPGVIAARRA
ncbi:MAG: bifunctional (p)ppGpp synthetase/guanosine-3',5'-bis(diphosphate) 3'-pyrophosphohydrolase, partial [Burkholderiales bacterium]|nr:bifunctional (p)ppGpp synthetase/guanosine-3',5'-bis(diphosphate) 3'-pyrophosphohydrolase [Burkholderiales bacterium]